ncbi:MAG: translation initiation factor IF-2, partial [Myxococcales bacterium]|nr:translation initiation factor IF-2 [Myxococcales bacterium]
MAKQLNLDPKAVVGLFQAIGLTDVRNHMSSVDPEAVERVKRHIEKQRTHDVVEERIRPTVVKRRAIAKPDGGPASVPTPSVSTPELTDVASRRDISALVPDRVSSPRLDTDVMAKDRESARMLRDVEADRVSSPRVEAPSSPSVVEDRKSSRTVKAAEPSVPEPAPSVREVQAAPPPPPPPSVREVQAAPPPPPSVREVAPERVPTPPPPSAPAVVEAAPVSAAPPPAPSVREPAPSVREAAPPPPPPEAPAPRQPKTGIEVWGGRPGVPMPTPAGVQRTGIGGGAPGAMPRRVQYDPRAGVGGSRGPMRPGGPGGGRGPMMGRGGPGGARGRMGGPQIPRKPPAVSTQEMSAHKKVIRIEENITLASMAAKMSLKATELLMKLLSMGMTGVHINTSLDADTAKILASEFGWEVEDVAISEEESIAAARGEDAEVAAVDVTADPNVQLRPPVVTVMGHVDHGKTSLLDRIRRTDVAGGEAGGITQHIGAYKVKTDNGTIVFLDTPGHEAFTAMRARGASVTDVIVLVVAADDGVMPQTKEAIAHAKAAKVPIIVAVNKIDKPSAEPERVRRELVEQGLQPEEWGGDTIFVNVSAHTGEGIGQLLEMIGLQAEVLDLKANPKKPASGIVLEALLDRGRGPVARVLVQEGTLKVGDFVLAGAGFGKVRAMTNEHGKQVHEAGPSTPVEILGLSDVPSAGDQLHAVKDAKKAQEIAESRKGKQKQNLIPTDQRISLEGIAERLRENEQLELRVIIKGDVQGSIEAVSQALTKLSTDRVRLSVIHAGVGAITEGDVNLAIASRAIIVGFNVRPAGKAASLAEENKIEIRLYSIIYNAVDDVKSAMEGLLPANLVEKQNGKAEVRQIFKIRGTVVAGCYVIQGTVKRAGNARLVRDGVVVWEGKLAALKRFKDDAKEVAEGF